MDLQKIPHMLWVLVALTVVVIGFCVTREQVFLAAILTLVGTLGGLAKQPQTPSRETTNIDELNVDVKK